VNAESGKAKSANAENKQMSNQRMSKASIVEFLMSKIILNEKKCPVFNHIYFFKNLIIFNA
jgi:hypothetical protein